MFANVLIHSLQLAGPPVQCMTCILIAKPTNAHMAQLMGCECVMINGGLLAFNSACCKLFLYNEAQDNHIHVDIPLHG